LGGDKYWEKDVAGGSTKAVYAALFANFGIAVAKFGGAAYTGSSAMVAEGVHSVVDTGNQLLLLLGMRRSERPANSHHPFGYSREIYFWCFVVAVCLFTAGGTFAIYEGVQKLAHPHAIENPIVNYVILAVAILLEAGSFAVALKEFRKVASGRHWWSAVTEAKDPVLFTVLFEDSAAMIGLVVALLGLIAADVLAIPALDGAASIVIGLVLICASLLLARETMSLIVGEAAAPEVLADVERLIRAEPSVTDVRDIVSVHLGPHDIVVAAAVDFQDDVPAGEVERVIARLVETMRTAQPDVKRLFLAPTSFAAN
jgi:cation diffusion facilitator family transporter